VFAVVVTVAPGAWDFVDRKLIVPAVVPITCFEVVFVTTWWQDFTIWKLAVTVFWGDASFQVGENHTFSALNGFFWFTEIDTSSEIVLTFSIAGGHGVTSLVAFEGAENFVVSSTGWCGCSGNTTWNGTSGVLWSGWSAWSCVSWAWKTDTLNFSVHAVTASTSIRLASNFFTLSVFNSVELHTEAVLLFQAFSTIFRQDSIVDTFTTFNTNFLTFFGDLIPSSDVSTSQWTSGDAWVVLPAAVALHWAKTLMSPRNVDTLLVTSLSIGGDGGTKTFAFSTGVASAGIVLTVFKVVVDINVSVTFREWTVLIFKNGTSFGGPCFSEWVQRANVFNVNWFWTGRNSFPRVSELQDVSSCDIVGGDEVVKNGSIVITTKTLNIGSFIDWVEFDHHVSTFVPHQSDTDFFSFNEYPETGESKSESGVSVSGDWRTSNYFDRRIANFESNRFSTNGTFRTASFVCSGNFEFSFDFSVNIFTFSLELKLLSIKSFDMAVTISFASTWTFFVGATPSAHFVTRTSVTVFHESFGFSIGFAAMETWTLFSNDATFSFFVENVAFQTLTAGLAVVIKVWVNFSVNVHVVASHLHWGFALNEFSVGRANLASGFASSFSTFPSTFVALADVAVLSPGFSGEEFSTVPVTRTFSWGDANAVVVQNSFSDTLATWNTNLNTLEVLVVFVAQSSARPVASFTAFLEFLAGWATHFTFALFSPVF
jgi:hypothetical protein